MEKFVTQALLYDFYGELLTEHQKRIYELVVLEDYSYSEIAKDEGISRQSVHDMIRRCDALLEGYEEKLQLIAKFLKTKELVGRIKTLSGEYNRNKDSSLVSEIETLADLIIDL